MSETRTVVREEIREILVDTSSSDTVFSSERINRMIQRHMRLIGNDVLQGQAWVTSAITMTSGTSDYTFPAGVEYAQILTLKLMPLNKVLFPRTVEWMEGQRQGQNLSRGQPYAYAIWEDTSQLVNIRFWPIPDATYTVDLERTVIPAALTSEASTIPFSENLIIGLEYRVAAELIGTADDGAMQQLGLGPSAAGLFSATADRTIQKEKERLSRLYSVPSYGKQAI